MEKHPIYTHEKSQQEFARAVKYIPAGVYGHLGPSEGCMIPVTEWPLFGERAKGSEFWDVDGNRYIDYMCAYGPNVLGYNDPDVDAAARAQYEKCNCTTSPSPAMVDFAETLCRVADRDWAFFAKNGNDVTQFAMMISRAYTGRKKLILVKGYYHGVSPWTQNEACPGTLAEDVCNNLMVTFNDIEGLKKVVRENKGEIAAFIATPYMHGNFTDNILPEPGYWQAVRKICDEEGIVLVIDDVRCGFRLDLRGSDRYYGFDADLICFCKALANGYNVSALCGKQKFRGAASSISYTGSYWMSAAPFAAGKACLEKMEKLGGPKVLKEKGEKLMAGFKKAADKWGFDLVVSGEPSLFYLRVADPDQNFFLHQEWICECVKRGLFLASHHNHFINYSLTDELIEESIQIADEAFEAVRKNHPIG